MNQRLKDLHDNLRLSCFDGDGMLSQWDDERSALPANLSRKDALLIIQELLSLRNFVDKITNND